MAQLKNVQWIESPNQHEEHSGQTLATRSHDVIKQRAEKRRAVPATVPRSRHDDHAGVLRFDFPGYGGQGLEHISWDEWFKAFDKRNLAFLFQEHTKDGKESNFFRLTSPDPEDA